jgi:prolyl oligopeptidase
MNYRTLAWIALMVVSVPTAAPAQPTPLVYPHTKKIKHVDVYHGTKVSDPYRWLEKDVREADDVKAWVQAENKVTFGFLKQIPQRKYLEKRLTELWNYERFGVPGKHGDTYFFTKNNGLQNQSVLYTLKSLSGKPRMLIDPNTWSKDGTVALGNVSVSDDGKYVAYGIQDGGSDWRTWRVINVASRKLLDDELKWVKFSNVSWTKDGKGFFYGRYQEPTKGAKFQSLNLNQKLMYHRVGTPQSEDTLVYERPDHPRWGYGTSVSDDGKYLVITVWKGTDDKYRVTYKDIRKPGSKPVDLIDNFEHEFTFLGNDGPLFYFKTSVDAPRRRVIAIDIRKPTSKNWKQIIPQAKETLSEVNLVGNQFFAKYLKDAKTQVKIFGTDGKFVREVMFAGIGTAAGFSGDRKNTETFYSFYSFATPPSIYRYDLKSGKSTVFRQPKVEFNPRDYVVKQVFYKSKDGTRVPMFLSYKKGLKRNGNNPTLLYAYGGFNIPLTPRFSVSRLLWMELGGVYAQANLRGGGEYGEAWHKAGTKLHKQNVFDDFIAAAEWLIANKYTRTQKLAIQGGSNGGLLIGAVMTQRPDLFGACLPAVGVMDMLRFHRFTAGRFWVDDYGSSDNPEEFKALYKYSPYHNLKLGTHYPPTLITTADTDDRVVPGHSFKFAARLQECQAGSAPVLIRIETRAGHGSGKPTAMQIEEIADQWAFLVKELGVQVEKR